MNPTSRRLACLPVVSLLAAASASGAIIHVDAAQALRPVNQNGASWPTAYQSLQSALAVAVAGDQIWVAGGTYKPTNDLNRSAAFSMKGGVQIYGGFHVGDTQLAQRDIEGNPSILSGEIGDQGLLTDNSFNVVRAVNVLSTGLLDGFTVRDGFADVNPNDASGGGIECSGGAPTIRHCTFEDNHANLGGGAMSNLSNARFVRCTFRGNSAALNGGGIEAQAGSVQLVDCRILGNTLTGGHGAGVRLLNDSATITGCLFAGNACTAGGAGGAIHVAGGVSSITNCTIVNNSTTNAGQGGAGVNVSGPATVTISNSILWNNLKSGVPDALALTGANPVVDRFRNDIQGMAPDANGNFGADPLFVDADGADDVAGTTDDDARLDGHSPCIDRADADRLPADAFDVDVDGNSFEPLPLDVDALPRRRDALVYDTGIGIVTHLDIGASEHRRAGTVICVHPEGKGATGLSWDQAVADLSIGFLNASDFELEDPVQVWVAAGTYLPTGGADRSISFHPPGNGIAVYGGFAGGEPSLLDRDPWVNPTILSGAIGSTVSDDDNSFHVIDYAGDQYNAPDVLDGFVITKGHAFGDATGQVGGGIRMRNSARPTIRNCTIVGNDALVGGGVSAQSGSSASIVGCLISGNDATAGGGVYTEASLSIRNCTIAGNGAESGGGGLFAVSPSVTEVLNTIVWGNTDQLFDDDRAQLAFEERLAFAIAYCVIECFGSSGVYGGAEATTNAHPRFANLAGDDGTIGTFDDDPSLEQYSPCIDAGKNGAGGVDEGDSDEDGVSGAELAPFDIALAPRIVDDAGVVDTGGDTAAIDIGCFEFQTTSSGPVPDPADLNDDGHVNGADITIVLGTWGFPGGDGDVNGDCSVDGADITQILGAWTG